MSFTKYKYFAELFTRQWLGDFNIKKEALSNVAIGHVNREFFNFQFQNKKGPFWGHAAEAILLSGTNNLLIINT